MTVRKYVAVVGMAVLLAVGLVVPRQGKAQARWVQTVQVIAPVSDTLVTGALLDTLITSVKAGDIQVQPAPDKQTRVGFQQIQSRLKQEGLGVSSATHVFITYRFHVNRLGPNTEILDLYFIFRSPQANEADIPIFYLNTKQPTVRTLLKEKGTTLPYNEAAFLRFWDQIKFHQLASVLSLVQVGDEIIRDETLAAAEKQRIMSIMDRYTYQ